MRNPLIKRLPRELKSEFGKYLVIFLFFIMVIGFVSGFLVTSASLQSEFHETFETYNIEHGNFELFYEADEALIETLEKEDVTLYENFYIEKDTKDFESTLRMFKKRGDVNRECVLEGELPTKQGEIAIDRVYAQNNGVAIGDTLKVGFKELKVTGYVALPDYSTMLSSPSDMMFDANMFGVGIVTEETFDNFGKGGFHYSYSWKYDEEPKDDAEAKNLSEEFLEMLAEHAMVVEYIPEYANMAIHFAGNDLGNDYMVIMVFLYIVVAIIAFIFAITTNNTIAKEATVIGTLRASGYSKGELLRHYMTMPVLVTLFSALIGNVLGYTYFRTVAEDMYLASYSLTRYDVLWNADAFVKTTVVPVILMVVINYVILAYKLRLSPLRFIRRDLSTRQKKKAIRLNTKIGIMQRFRMRIIFQNMPNYIMIFVGIFFANIILLLGIAFPSLLHKYEDDITDNMICDYQYILKAPADTEVEDAEQYCAGSLTYVAESGQEEDATLFGIIPDSQYIDIELENDNVYISDAFSEKYHIAEGDTIELKEFGGKTYRFHVDGIYHYPSSLAVFMSKEYFNKTFDYEEDYYSGYFSNTEIDDIDEMYIATQITVSDMTKTSRQLIDSMGSMMDMLFLFGVVMFMLIIYLLSKIIIEKNAQSISMTKILGYTNGEIGGLYIMSTTIVVILSMLVTLPLVDKLMEYACKIMLSTFSGWFPYYVPSYAYIAVVAAGILSYAVIAFIQFRKVKKVPMDMALKNVE
ncbi:MAG: ABC transporter permease [Lachnospiraceae bacterium]|nr:ABC transporter permease [Lachnospiraceae bacterium]